MKSYILLMLCPNFMKKELILRSECHLKLSYYFTVLISLFYFYLVLLGHAICGSWDLSSLTRERTQDHSSETTQS